MRWLRRFRLLASGPFLAMIIGVAACAGDEEIIDYWPLPSYSFIYQEPDAPLLGLELWLEGDDADTGFVGVTCNGPDANGKTELRSDYAALLARLLADWIYLDADSDDFWRTDAEPCLRNDPSDMTCLDGYLRIEGTPPAGFVYDYFLILSLDPESDQSPESTLLVDLFRKTHARCIEKGS